PESPCPSDRHQMAGTPLRLGAQPSLDFSNVVGFGRRARPPRVDFRSWEWVARTSVMDRVNSGSRDPSPKVVALAQCESVGTRVRLGKTVTGGIRRGVAFKRS